MEHHGSITGSLLPAWGITAPLQGACCLHGASRLHYREPVACMGHHGSMTGSLYLHGAGGSRGQQASMALLLLLPITSMQSCRSRAVAQARVTQQTQHTFPSPVPLHLARGSQKFPSMEV